MKLAWLTDIHLNFLNQKARMKFYQTIVDVFPDKFLLTGDIAEAPTVVELLIEMAHSVKKPIYFVLGNHDYYRGKIDIVRKTMFDLKTKEPLLNYLPSIGLECLKDGIVLIGQDGWADGRYGDYFNSPLKLNDSRFIGDLIQANVQGKDALLRGMQKLASTDAEQLKQNLTDVVKNKKLKRVIILLHVPPFSEVCLYQSQPTDNDFLPFFASKITGDVLLEFAKNYSDIDFLVLCGHTHHEACVSVCDNLTVKTGAAEYSYPGVQEVIEI